MGVGTVQCGRQPSIYHNNGGGKKRAAVFDDTKASISRLLCGCLWLVHPHHNPMMMMLMMDCETRDGKDLFVGLAVAGTLWYRTLLLRSCLRFRFGVRNTALSGKDFGKSSFYL